MMLPQDYTTFLRKIKHHDIGDLGEFIELFSSTDQLMESRHPFSKSYPACFILDYTQKKYLYGSAGLGRIIDRPVSYVLDGGLDFATSFWNREDLKLYSERVLPQNLEFLKATPVDQHADYLISYNYRIKTKKGEVKHIIQQSVFIKSADNGMPLAVMGLLFDVSKVNYDRRIKHTIERQQPAGRNSASMQLLENIYFLDEKDHRLTRREIEILKYLCEDLDSEQIGDKMNISKHTVDNHRRSLLYKTQSKSSVGLVRFAFSEGYV